MVGKPIRSDIFDLSGRVAVITGGAGLLGKQHAIAIHAFGGIPVIADVNLMAAQQVAAEISTAIALEMDVTDPPSVAVCRDGILKQFGSVDILINNAARDPKVDESSTALAQGRVEDFNLEAWNLDLAVGLTGAVLCSRYFGETMAKRGKGVILNIASDLALIAPNQSLYEIPDLPPEKQPTKPV